MKLWHGITFLFTHLNASHEKIAWHIRELSGFKAIFLVPLANLSFLVALLPLSLSLSSAYFTLLWDFKIPLTHQISFRFFLNEFLHWLIVLCSKLCSPHRAEWIIVRLLAILHLLHAVSFTRLQISGSCSVSSAVHYFCYLSLWIFAEFFLFLNHSLYIKAS